MRTIITQLRLTMEILILMIINAIMTINKILNRHNHLSLEE